MRPFGAVLACLLLLVAACDVTGDDDDAIRGSGNVITEDRSVSGFDQISVEGFGEVIVEIGSAESLTIEAEDNVMPLLVTEVDGRTLEIKTEEGTSFRDIEEPVYTITMPDLVLAAIAGSGDVTATGIATDSFTVSIAGSGDIDAEGSAVALTVSISGSGNFHGEDLATTEGIVNIAGSGSVVITATDSLEVSIGGSGNVTYLGDPVLTVSIGGSGTVNEG